MLSELVQFETELHLSGGNQYKIDTSDKKSLLGQGAFGVVVKALCTSTNELVAVKKVLPSILSQPHLALKTLREIQALLHFSECDNVIKILNIYNGPTTSFSGHDFEYLFIVTELCDFDLSKIISPVNFSNGFKLSHHHFRYFTYQLCLAMTSLHSAGTLHRDLKPSNILIRKDCSLKLCDFGLVRSLDQNIHGNLTEYVVTRWYRSPEVTMGVEYGASTDVWSIGCIVYEMITTRPLLPIQARQMVGARGQLLTLLQRLGVPPMEDVAKITNEKAREFVQEHYSKCPKFPNPELCKEFNTESEEEMRALDFILKCLEFNPEKRLTVSQLLRHPYLIQFYDGGKINRASQTSRFLPDAIIVDENSTVQANLRRIKKNIRDVIYSFHHDDSSYSTFSVDEDDRDEDCSFA